MAQIVVIVNAGIQVVKNVRRRLSLLLLLALILAAAFALSRLKTAAQTSPRLTLHSVPGQYMKELGYIFEYPDVKAMVSRHAAETMALRQAGTKQHVNEAILARVLDRHMPRLNGHITWVISLQPNGTMTTTTGASATEVADIVFIDAQSGEFLGEAHYGVYATSGAP